MANSNTISIRLTVNDDGSVTMKQFGKTAGESLDKAKNSATRATNTFQTLKGSYLEFTAKAASAYMAITKAMEYMDQGAKAEQAEDSFRTLADVSNESANKIIENMKRATNSTIDDSAMMQKSAKAMMMEFSGDKIEKMSEMARYGARTSGENVAQVFDSIVDSISTNMPKALKQYGLITKEQMKIINQAMAEGVDGIDLYSLAVANLAAQQAKMGPLVENDAEKLQQYRAQIEDFTETIGKLMLIAAGEGLQLLPAVALFISSGDISLLEDYIKKLGDVDDSQKKVTETNKAAAEENRKNIENQIKAAQAAVAQKKTELDTMKALNKEYFTSQEENIKSITEILKAAGDDEYTITLEYLKKREALNAEYYTRTKKEIELEAAARQKADRDKVSDATYIAQKMQALDADTASKAIAMIRSKQLAGIQAAQNDINSLKTRLSDYQAYYDSLKAKMDKNIADEKAHLDEIKMLRQQQIAYEKTAADTLAMMQGTDKNLTSQQKYESGRSALNQQYFDALNLGGQDRITALEDYIKAVGQLQQQFQNGVTGANDIFGKPDVIISAKTVLEDAMSDVNRALNDQRNTTAALVEEQQKMAEADRLWGQVIRQEAQTAQNEMERLKNIIADLSSQIESMKKTVELTGVDHVSSVVDQITEKIKQLHQLAAQPISLNVSGSGYSSSGSGLNLDAYLNLDSLNLGNGIPKLAKGTDYVPQTGLYMLHKGEAVITADDNKSGRSGVNISGDIIINVPSSAASGRADDWRYITRNYIIPELKKLN